MSPHTTITTFKNPLPPEKQKNYSLPKKKKKTTSPLQNLKLKNYTVANVQTKG